MSRRRLTLLAATFAVLCSGCGGSPAPNVPFTSVTPAASVSPGASGSPTAADGGHAPSSPAPVSPAVTVTRTSPAPVHTTAPAGSAAPSDGSPSAGGPNGSRSASPAVTQTVGPLGGGGVQVIPGNGGDTGPGNQVGPTGSGGL